MSPHLRAPFASRWIASAIALSCAVTAGAARADDTSASPPPPAAAPPSASSTPAYPDPRAGLDPFPSAGRYIAYGFSFHSEAVLSSGRLCPANAKESCVLGGGGGISLAGYYRAQRYSLGAAYEASFHDSSNIYQRGVLQQLRGELRYRPQIPFLGEALTPFVGVGAGLATYGDNWAVQTYGPSAHLMVGTEVDLSVKLGVVFAIAYRAFYFRPFTDPSGQERPAGIAHMLGFQLGLELREPL